MNPLNPPFHLIEFIKTIDYRCQCWAEYCRLF